MGFPHGSSRCLRLTLIKRRLKALVKKLVTGAGGPLVVERIPCLLTLASVRYKQLQSYLIKLEVQMKWVPNVDTAAIHGFLQYYHQVQPQMQTLLQ